MNKEELESREDENDNNSESLKIPWRSTHNKQTPIKYPEKENSSEIYANYCRVDTLVDLRRRFVVKIVKIENRL